ncbi:MULTISPECIES: hypothetical protein [unclassified Pseudomonas]|uniref:hypothetical protein n=2 Tax=Pseudomonas TaxID=286 RepID=UPI001F5BECC1|nr:MULTISPECIES: hypothetical protein [unclassified Pseudomonas]
MGERPVAVMRPIDPTLFNPLQFQSRSLLSLCKSSMWSWFSERLDISFPGLIREHHQSLVAVEADVDYLRPFGMFDSDWFQVSVEQVRLRQDNTVLEIFHQFQADGGVFAKVRMLWRLLELDGDAALTGVPGQLRGSVLKHLLPAEVDPGREPRYVDAQVALIEDEGERVAGAEYRFTLYRHLCEVADQWCFLEVPGLASEGRERLVDALVDDPLALRSGLGKPLQEVLVKLCCPFYLFDEGEVRTTTFIHHGNPVYIHRVINLTRDNRLAAVVIETF